MIFNGFLWIFKPSALLDVFFFFFLLLWIFFSCLKHWWLCSHRFSLLAFFFFLFLYERKIKKICENLFVGLQWWLFVIFGCWAFARLWNRYSLRAQLYMILRLRMLQWLKILLLFFNFSLHKFSINFITC